MLAHSREYGDGKYYYAILPMKDLGNLVILERGEEHETLKKYFTEDDETAIAIFEDMVQLQEERGDIDLENYKVGNRLQFEFVSRVRVDKE
jgi:hypothetical protein